jgi:hypothetical protein
MKRVKRKIDSLGISPKSWFLDGVEVWILASSPCRINSPIPAVNRLASFHGVRKFLPKFLRQGHAGRFRAEENDAVDVAHRRDG